MPQATSKLRIYIIELLVSCSIEFRKSLVPVFTGGEKKASKLSYQYLATTANKLFLNVTCGFKL